LKFTSSSLFVFLVGLAAASGQIPYPNPINHVIIIDQENRSLDNLLGSNSPSNLYYLPGLNVSRAGKAYTISNGVKQVFRVNSVAIPMASVPGSPGSIDADDYDPTHSHEPAFTESCDAPLITDPSNKCLMDGFNQVRVQCYPGVKGCPGPKYPTYAYVQYSDVEPYFQMASRYGYANRMFQTNQGSSFPSHQFTFGGTSQPGVGSEPTWFVVENQTPNTNANGCIALPQETVRLVNPATADENTPIYPCFTHRTMADLFVTHNPPITWTYYTTGYPSLWSAPNAISTICTNSAGACAGPYWTKGAANGYVDPLPSDVLTDIDNCALNQVDWVIPIGLQSDHATLTDGSGPSWVASIVNAIGESRCTDVVDGHTLTYWQDSVILITWDDWGGWYDHVVPPPVPAKAPQEASSYVYGFRVPLLVVSAYTPAGTVSNRNLDFGAMLKFTEEIFGGLGTISNDPLNRYADYYAYDDLSEFFQFTQPPRSFETIQAPLDKSVFLDPNRPAEPPDND
jgi:phospholipase C